MEGWTETDINKANLNKILKCTKKDHGLHY